MDVRGDHLRQEHDGATHPARPEPVAVVSDPLGELLRQSIKAGSIVTFDIPVSDDVALCGFTLSTQAVHFGSGILALSNAQELTVGL